MNISASNFMNDAKVPCVVKILEIKQKINQ